MAAFFASPSDDTADPRLPLPRLDDILEQQQRWWNEWIEAGQIWTSWWFAQMPPFGWPPVGQVWPTEATAPAATVGSTATGTAGEPVHDTPRAGVSPVPPRSRNSGARHH